MTYFDCGPIFHKFNKNFVNYTRVSKVSCNFTENMGQIISVNLSPVPARSPAPNGGEMLKFIS